MGAQLVWVEDDRELGTTPLDERPLVIGRDASADWVIPHPRISRHHARIDPLDDGWAITDLGSRNGTRVNGKRVSGPVRLEPDDRIELAEVALVFEVERERRWGRAAVAAAALLGLALVIAGGALFMRSRDPVMREALALAREGVAAHEAGDAALAKQRLNAAVGFLYARGRLDDVRRLQVREEGLRRLGAQLGGSVDLLSLYNGVVEASRPTLPDAGPRGPCRLDRIGSAELDACIRERAERVLVELWESPPRIPERFYGAVNEQLRFLAGARRQWFEDSLERGRPWFPLMDDAFGTARVPLILRYLALIESGYQTGIRSPAGARGIWQFMPGTARQFGLKVDASLDERTDPHKSTHAAARYFHDLAFEFGGDAMLLAVASYNAGENGIRRALKRLDDPRTERSYWTLVERGLIPAETQGYVPRFVAAAVLGEAGLPPRELVTVVR